MGTLTALFRPAPRQPLGYWESTARREVLDAIQRAKMAEDAERRRIQRALHGFLDGVHRAELESRLSVLYPETAPSWNRDEAGHRYFPLIQTYAERLAVCFASPPDLWLEDASTGERLPDEDPRSRQLARDVEEAGLATALPTIERWVACGMRTALMQPMLRAGRIEWQPHAPYEVWVDQDPASPSQLRGAPHVTVVLPQRNDSGGSVADEVLYLTWERRDERDDFGAVTGTTWWCWLHDEGGNLKNNSLFRDNVNGYGMHPFGVWREADPPSGDFWIEPNKGWYHAQLAADIQLCDLDHHARHQIHSTLFGRGMTDLKTLPHGPDKAVNAVDPEADLKYVTPDARFEELQGLINFERRMDAVAEGLPPDTWEASSSTRNLGAKQLEQAALKLRRGRVEPYYVRGLRDTFAAHFAVGDFWAARLGRVRYGAVRIGVELAALPEVADRFQSSQATIADIAADLDNPVDALMRRDGLTRRQAQEAVARNRTGGMPVTETPEVEAVTLNGAQVQAAAEIVGKVAIRELPRDSGLAMLQAFFGLTTEQAEAVVGSAGEAFESAPKATPPIVSAAGMVPPSPVAGEGVPRPASAD